MSTREGSVPACEAVVHFWVAMAKPAKRRVQGGRTTPRRRPGTPTPKQTTVERRRAGRYTPPVPRDVKVSPPWVPILMFTFLGLGTLMILLNYIGARCRDSSNWVLLGGLGLILAGIITATQYR